MEKYLPAAIALLIALITIVFTYGQLTQRDRDKERRIELVEKGQLKQVDGTVLVLDRLARLETKIDAWAEDIKGRRTAEMSAVQEKLETISRQMEELSR